MSKEDIERFSNDIVNNKNLQDEIVKSSTQIDDLVALAKRHGYDFTAKELQEYAEAKKAELSTSLNQGISDGGYNTHAAVVVINAGALVVLGH